MVRINQIVKVKPNAIIEFLDKRNISEIRLSGGLYLDKDRLNFILTTGAVNLVDAKMLTRFCYEQNIDSVLEFTSHRQKRFVIKAARAW